jgi:hypothetical protein
LPAPATKISSLLVPTKISTPPLPKWSIAYFESLLSLVKRARIDGGGNIDTLKLNGNDLILDLTNISNARIQDIEKINISGSGDKTLIVNLNDVLDASTSTNILKVLGNNNDTVNALGFTKASGAETEGSITYDAKEAEILLQP